MPSPIVKLVSDPEASVYDTVGEQINRYGLGSRSVYERFSHSFVLERSTSSTLPFAIDDPPRDHTKGADINEVIVDVFNKGKAGKCKRGGKVLLSMPLISTNYPISTDERVSSRSCVVQFHKPSIGPHSMEQQGKLAHLHDLIESGNLSSLIGFVIRKRGELNDTSVWKNKLMSHFKGRSLNNWALVVQSVHELLHEAGCDSEEMMEQVVMFICSDKDVQSSDDKILKETFSVLDTLTAEMNCNEILEFLRTDVTVAGRDVVAVVLNDIEEKLPYPVPAIRQ
uniref:Uncharacterized protein n=1 Tax=Amphimedon queenslandica TaxID=400682 RepID=A0A1X7T665_AMPQE